MFGIGLEPTTEVYIKTLPKLDLNQRRCELLRKTRAKKDKDLNLALRVFIQTLDPVNPLSSAQHSPWKP